MSEKKRIEESCADQLEYLKKIRLLIIERLSKNKFILQSDFLKSFDESMQCDVLFTLGMLCERGEVEKIDAHFPTTLRLI